MTTIQKKACLRAAPPKRVIRNNSSQAAQTMPSKSVSNSTSCAKRSSTVVAPRTLPTSGA